MSKTAYQRVLGPAWNELPAMTRRLHSPDPVVVFEGKADIRRTLNPLANFAADLMGLPKSGTNVPARITVTRHDHGETLNRDYGGRVFETHQTVEKCNGQFVLKEQVGPFILTLQLIGHSEGIDFHLQHATLWGLPLPRWLSPAVSARERADGDAHLFQVKSALPLIGELVSYEGRLTEIA
ncbi:DUF4166 domain-containing protein [Hyphobacterium sp.]|uniref:DUF4166 domain-containing protein n=1 Tax=Hyphobacterium sp. TaxID=2004662 RepID=UPI003BAB65FE